MRKLKNNNIKKIKKPIINSARKGGCQKEFNGYFDLDAIVFIFNTKNFIDIVNDWSNTYLTISYNNNKKIINKNKLIFGNSINLKSKNSIFSTEKYTNYGRVDLYFVYDDENFDKKIFYDRIFKISSKNFHS